MGVCGAFTAWPPSNRLCTVEFLFSSMSVVSSLVRLQRLCFLCKAQSKGFGYRGLVRLSPSLSVGNCTGNIVGGVASRNALHTRLWRRGVSLNKA